MKLKELEKEVRGFLITEPKTRASDDLLYVMLIEGRLQRMGKSLQRISAHDYLLHYRKYGLPTIESVGRCRRKIQEKDESLKKGNGKQFCSICSWIFGVDILGVDNKKNMC